MDLISLSVTVEPMEHYSISSVAKSVTFKHINANTTGTRIGYAYVHNMSCLIHTCHCAKTTRYKRLIY